MLLMFIRKTFISSRWFFGFMDTLKQFSIFFTLSRIRSFSSNQEMLQPTLFLFFKNYVFIFSCAGFSLLFSGFLSFWCMGFSCCRTQALGPWASVVVAQGLSCPRRVESSWARDQTCVLCIEDNASGFLTTEPPGKSENSIILYGW